MDTNVIIENLTELLTNTVNMTSVFYDIFLNPEPMDVTLQQYNDQNELVTVTIPNRAKDRSESLSGEGTPEGNVEAPIGTMYIDTQFSQVYIKVSGSDQYGWLSILNQTSVIPILRAYLINSGYVTENAMSNFIDSKGFVTSEDYASSEDYGVIKIDEDSLVNNGNLQLSVAGIVPSVANGDNISGATKKLWVGLSSSYSQLGGSVDPDTFYVLEDLGVVLLGNTQIAANGQPSNVGSTLGPSLPVSGDQVTLLEDGVVYINVYSTAAGQYIDVEKENGQKYISHSTASGQEVVVNVPVSKGETITIYYTVGGALNAFKFYVNESKNWE